MTSSYENKWTIIDCDQSPRHDCRLLGKESVTGYMCLWNNSSRMPEEQLFKTETTQTRQAIADALVAAAERVEAAVPADTDVRADRSVAVRLPPAIRGDPYRVVVANDTSTPALRLVHPDASVDGRIRLTVPDATVVRGSWDSAPPSRAVVVVTEGRISIRLLNERDGTSRLAARDPSRGSVSSTAEREAAT